jgi:hypothetical protein
VSRRDLEQAAIAVADRCLKAKGHINMVDVLIELKRLSREDYERWRLGQVPFLERVILGNLAKLKAVLSAVQTNSARGKLTARTTAYWSRGKRKRQRLWFTKSGDPNLERAYATHYLLPHPPADKVSAP